VIEPFFLKDHGRMVKKENNVDSLKKTQIVHFIILVLSLITIAVSVMGAHGYFLQI
jgi:nitrate reductase NapE component